MDTDIKRPGRKRLQILWTSFMDGPNTLKGWNQLLLLDYLPIYRLTMPSEKVNLLTTTSMTLLYYHRYQRYNKMFWII